jgi:hypothetical protein
MVEEGLFALLIEEFGEGRIVKRGQTIGAFVTMTPDVVMPLDGNVMDIKYKRTKSDWSRDDLYQIVAFAHAFKARSAAVSSFSEGQRLQSLSVGDTPIHHFVWPAGRSTPVETARRQWLDQVRSWLQLAAAVN